MAKLPQFGILYNQDFEKLDKLIAAGKIKYPMYLWDDVSNFFYFIKKDGTYDAMVGNNPAHVKRVSNLPDPGDADGETLYIRGSTVYQYDPEVQTFYPTYQDVLDRIETLEDDVGKVSDQYETLAADVANVKTEVDQKLSECQDAIDAIREEADAVADRFGNLGENETVTEYVDASSEAAVQSANDYADSLFELIIV